MRVYDVALVFIRSYAALQLIHAAIETLSTILRLGLIFGAGLDRGIWLGAMFSSWQAPLDLAVTGVVALAASRPIARFAARFATHSDAASAF